jgi:methylmalonyl-CoA mutase
MIPNLFREFSPSSKEAWKNQAIRDLKGRDFEQSLKSRLWGKIELEPFYTREDVIGLSKLPGNCFEEASQEASFSARNWMNFASVHPGQGNKEILHLLENGASGLILHLRGDEDLAERLKGVIPGYISIMVKPLGDPLAALHVFFDWAQKSGIEQTALSGGFLWSPMDLLFEKNQTWEDALETFGRAIELCRGCRNFHAFAYNFSRYHESGATGLDELIFGFGELIELISSSGIEPALVFEKGFFYTSVGESHFPEMAKLKAMRCFAADLAWQYGIDLTPQDIYILAKTSDWSKSALDANTNLIRQTYEAMASVLGGANGLWLKPLQEEKAGRMELRIARNVSSILADESHLGKVADPTSGSYYLEVLASRVYENLKLELQEMEESGGWLDGFNAGKIQQRVRESRQIHQNAVLSGQISKIGVNRYPAPNQLKADLEIAPIQEKAQELKPFRASYLVELENQRKHAAGL